MIGLDINGLQVIENKYMISGHQKYPVRKSKSKRIQKKFNKKYGFRYRDIADKRVYISDGKLIGHPKTIKKLLEKI